MIQKKHLLRQYRYTTLTSGLLCRIILLSLIAISICLPTISAGNSQSDRLALVLSGGGARGGAHVGVLKMLEKQGIVPDFVVGTSFGSLVGGLYAAGYSATEIENILTKSEMETLFQQLSPRDSLSFRRKKDDDDLLIKLRLRLEGKKVKISNSLVSGHRFRIWLAQQLNNKPGSTTFEGLRLDFRTVATDLTAGSEVVISDGRVADAIYASMALPGLMEPLNRNGRILVDGGLVNNLPVSVAQSLGATHIIAVDVGTPYYEKDEINTSFQVVDQMARLLTRGNTERTIENLGENTLLISPELEGVSTAAFEVIEDAIKSGEEIAEKFSDKIGSFKNKSAHDRRLKHIDTPALSSNPSIAAINITSDSALSESYLKSHFRTKIGQPLDEMKLNKDIARLHGTGLFDRIRYSTHTFEDQAKVDIEATEIQGRNFIQFGLFIDEDFEQVSEYGLSTSFTKTQVNSWGAEWQTQLKLGDEQSLETEFYQPFGAHSEYFVSVGSIYLRPEVVLPQDDLTLSSEHFNAVAARWEVGRHFENWGRLSISGIRGRVFLDLPPIPDLDFGFAQLNFQRDTLDEPAFPTRGERIVISNQWARRSLGNDTDGELLALDAIKFFTRDKDTFALWGTVATTFDDDDEANTLNAGGFLNLSGFDNDEFEGKHLAILRGLYYRRFRGNKLTNIFDTPLYFGSSIEYGGVWDKKNDASFSNSSLAGSLFIGANSVVGPLFFGFGLTENDNHAFYLSVGRPFIYQLTSTFE